MLKITVKKGNGFWYGIREQGKARISLRLPFRVTTSPMVVYEFLREQYPDATILLQLN